MCKAVAAEACTDNEKSYKYCLSYTYARKRQARVYANSNLHPSEAHTPNEFLGGRLLARPRKKPHETKNRPHDRENSRTGRENIVYGKKHPHEQGLKLRLTKNRRTTARIPALEEKILFMEENIRTRHKNCGIRD